MSPALIDREVAANCEAVFNLSHARAFFSIQTCTEKHGGGARVARLI